MDAGEADRTTWGVYQVKVRSKHTHRRFKPFRFGLTDDLIKKGVKFNRFVMTG